MSWLNRVFGGLLGDSGHGSQLALPGPGPSLDRWDDGVEIRHDSVVNPYTGLGGDGDKGSAARPNVWSLPLMRDELRALYLHNGMARRIIDLPADRAVRRGWSAPDIPATEDKRLRVYPRVRTGMKMGRLYGGAATLMVTEDDVPRAFREQPWAWLRQPLDLQRVGKLHALHTFDAHEAWPLSYDEDIRSPGFRDPLLWQISSNRFHGTVHSSRVIWWRGAPRPPNESRGGWWSTLPDDSVLEAMWAEIRRLTETMQGGAVLAQELRESVLKIHGLAGLATGDQSAELKERMGLISAMKSILGVILLGDNDEYENRSNPPTGFKELSEGALTMLCLVLGWPRTMLAGEAPAGLSTDDAAGLERERQIISDYQEQHRDELERLYSVVYAAQDGPTRGKTPDEWALEFAPLDEPDEEKEARIRKLVAETDHIYMQDGVYGPEHVAENRLGEGGWVMDLPPPPIPDPESDERAIEQARKLLQAAGGADPGAGDEGDDAEPRADADGSGCFVIVPAAPVPADLASAAAAALGSPPLPLPGTDPHVTVLYVGEDLEPEAVSEVVTVTTSEAADLEIYPLGGGQLRAFPPGPRGVPIVVELQDAWGLEQLHDRLLRRLAHRVTARQHRRFRAHLTLGYVPELSTEAATRLMAVDASAVRVPVLELRVRAGGQTVATVAVGGES